METSPLALTQEESEYIALHQKELQIAVDNCYLLLDPKQTQKPEELFKFIESNPTDRMYLYMFIVNTCELVENLEPIHIIGVSEAYKTMSDEDLYKFSKAIQEVFFTASDVRNGGQLQFIWANLLDHCCMKLPPVNKTDGETIEKTEAEPLEL